MAFKLKMDPAAQAGAASTLTVSDGKTVGTARGSLTALMSLQRSLQSLSVCSEKIKALKGLYEQGKAVLGTFVDDADARLNGFQALTSTTMPVAATATGVSLDEGSDTRQNHSIIYQLSRLGKVLLPTFENLLEVETALYNAVSSFMSKENLEALGIDLDDNMMGLLIALSPNGGGGLFGGEQIPVELDNNDPSIRA